MVIILGLGAAFFAAITNVYLKKLFDNSSSRELAPLNFLINFLILLIFCPFFFYFKISSLSITLFLGISILEFLANYFYYIGIENTEVSYVSISTSLTPIFTLLISTIFIGLVSFKTVFAVFGIVISVYILNLDKGFTIEPLKKIFTNKNYYGLAAAFFSGSSAILIKIMFNNNYTNPATLYMMRCFIILLLFLVFFKPDRKVINFKIIFSVFIRAIFVIIHLLLFYYAISAGNVIAASTAANTTALFVLLLSRLIFKEKITPQKLFAIFSIIGFMVLLNYTI